MEIGTRAVSRIFGEWRVDLVDAGGLALDGGSMFGSVPRGLWQRLIEPDEQHRIPLAMRLLLVRHRSGAPQVLVDTGIGDKFDAKFAKRFAVEAPPGDRQLPIERALATHGVQIGDLTHVILTHLHFDHGGGVSRLDSEGASVPTFPAATHILQRANRATALAPNLREKASYFRENVDPLDDVRLELVEDEAEVLPGISVIRSNGHTDGMQVVRIEGGGRVLYYLADLAPTQHHVPIAFTMGYDLCAREIMAEKAAVWSRALDEEAILVFEHDPRVGAAQLTRERDRYRVGALIELED